MAARLRIVKYMVLYPCIYSCIYICIYNWGNYFIRLFSIYDPGMHPRLYTADIWDPDPWWESSQETAWHCLYMHTCTDTHIYSRNIFLCTHSCMCCTHIHTQIPTTTTIELDLTTSSVSSGICASFLALAMWSASGAQHPFINWDVSWDIPPGNQTWQWTIPYKWVYIYKWRFKNGGLDGERGAFNCHVKYRRVLRLGMINR